MAVVFGSDEWSLNDIQVSSHHRYWCMTTVKGKVTPILNCNLHSLQLAVVLKYSKWQP